MNAKSHFYDCEPICIDISIFTVFVAVHLYFFEVYFWVQEYLSSERSCSPSFLTEWVGLVWILARTPAILTEVFHRFLQSLQANASMVPQLCHDRFLPNPLQFIHKSYYFTLWDTNSVIKYTTKENLFKWL
jgi:hypothetical protein